MSQPVRRVGFGEIDEMELLELEGDHLLESVREGFPFESYERLSEVLDLSLHDLAAILAISERTLRRRRKEGRLTPEESDRLLRIVRLLKLSLQVFEGDRESAVRWLLAPKSRLGGESPLERAETELGGREVEDMLYAIEFTMPA